MNLRPSGYEPDEQGAVGQWRFQESTYRNTKVQETSSVFPDAEIQNMVAVVHDMALPVEA